MGMRRYVGSLKELNWRFKKLVVLVWLIDGDNEFVLFALDLEKSCCCSLGYMLLALLQVQDRSYY